METTKRINPKPRPTRVGVVLPASGNCGSGVAVGVGLEVGVAVVVGVAVGVAVGQEQSVSVVHEGLRQEPEEQINPDSQPALEVQELLHEAGVGVGVGQIQSVSEVQLGFLHLPDEQVSPVWQSLLAVHVPLHAVKGTVNEKLRLQVLVKAGVGEGWSIGQSLPVRHADQTMSPVSSPGVVKAGQFPIEVNQESV